MIIIKNLNDLENLYETVPYKVINEIDIILKISKCIEEKCIVIYINEKIDYKKLKEFYIDINNCTPIYVDKIIYNKEIYYNVLYETRSNSSITLIIPKDLATQAINEYSKKLCRSYQKY